MVFSILLKNERNSLFWVKREAQGSEFRSFFGRIEDTINGFRDLLTFNIAVKKYSYQLWTINFWTASKASYLTLWSAWPNRLITSVFPWSCSSTLKYETTLYFLADIYFWLIILLTSKQQNIFDNGKLVKFKGLPF